MKFGKFFEEELANSLVPKEWTKGAIQYKALKKTLHRFINQSGEIGLSKEFLKTLIENNLNSSEYDDLLNEKIENGIKSPLNEKYDNIDVQYIYLDREVTKPVGKYIIEENQRYVKPRLSVILTGDPNDVVSSKILENLQISSTGCTKISFTLEEDDKFFKMIFDELEDIGRIRKSQEDGISRAIEDIAKSVSTLAKPSKWRNDMDNWREIFELYLSNRIYYQTDDLHGERTPEEIQKRLLNFLNEAKETNLIKRFKHAKSKKMFYYFYSLNQELSNFIKFQNLNKLAISKILKKFDKQTSFTIKNKFPLIIPDGSGLVSQTFIRKFYSLMTEKLVCILPQIEDYSCPICMSIAYKPIRLNCSHVFCIQCLIKLQRDRVENCPVCRAPSVLSADSTNLDEALMKYMKKHFPKQAKEKFNERQKEIAAENYARALHQYQAQQCIIM